MSHDPNMFGEFVYKRTYARWLENEQRRENWDETVFRYRDYFIERFDLPPEMDKKFFDACVGILNKEVVPSMRALWTAGKALDVENMAGYNCTFLLIDSVKSWADMLYLLMNGCGVGYSVERQVINKLPEVPAIIIESPRKVIFEDSKLGWAEGLFGYLNSIYNGELIGYDLSLIRPKGARLKTFGGKAGGSEDLRMLLDYLRRVFMKARGRRLTSIECHDICCFIANVVVSAGVRRSACISLSNLSDPRMRDCKIGEFWLSNPQRAMANNSVAYTEKPDMHIFMQEWTALMNSGSGERGIFNRASAINTFEELGRSTSDSEGNVYVVGCNPCGEVFLRPKQACNLTECIVRPTDTLDSLIRKVESATVLGCMQACLTSTKFLDHEWKKNMAEERLLGVSLTGVRDHPILGKVSQLSSTWLNIMRDHAHSVASECAEILGINTPAAVTCSKPSGTVSAVMNTASGVHTRFAPYYLRRVRVSSTDVLCDFLRNEGVPHHPEVGQDKETANTWVFEFPVASPKDSVFDTPALEQLEYWRMFKVCWTDHNPSVTITIEEDEWLEVGAWVYRNWDIVGGLSFLPKSDNVYQLAPFQAISKEWRARLGGARYND
jgi:ribonucleoside-diphosphate reductase alpha chain